MIVISVIFAVIGSFIYALIKIINAIDKKLEILSMEKQSKLSLKRNRYHQAHVTNDVPVEISDDESSDSSSNPQSNIEQVNFTNTSHGVADISNDATNSLNPACSLKHIHDISDDLSSDEDVVVIDMPNTSKNTQSMFNWKKTSFAYAPSCQNDNSSVNILHDSRLEKEMPGEVSSKRQKLRSDLTSLSDDDLASLNKEESSPSKVTIQHNIMIAGTKVTLPVEPYPCQKAVMNSLIKGCTKEQHCLLESPTGSGKTLALLCGALAWQEQYREKLKQEESNKINAENSCCDDEDSLDDNFYLNSSQYFDEEWCDEVLHKAKMRKVPKIYYGTRTHKQIEQVVRELKRTVYRDKRMTILSSRKQTCIQNSNRDKDELCHELLDPLKSDKCRYYNDQNKRRMMLFNGLETPWDIEDLISLGRNTGTCPYFGARSLMDKAEIIFCPYAYIVAPDIRESMQINLKGDIVIFDEAHNIENICLEAASVNLRNDDLMIAANDCKYYDRKCRDRNIYITIQNYLTDIVKFLETIHVKQNDNEMVSDYWLGAEFLVLLDMHNIGNSRFPDFHNASKMAIQDFKEMKQEARPDKIVQTISHDTKKILEHLCFAIQMLTSDIFVNDFRVCVKESMKPCKKIIPKDVWISTKNKPLRELKLLCMNPAIVFAPLARTARSVIVASGTLTPITSFQSELGTKFPHIVNPDHIISKEQVYVRCIPRGPNGKTLIATYENVNSWNFQDELGSLVLQVCDTVPYGVLCFFPSYLAMNKLLDRWKNNDTLSKLEKLKEIFVEPRNRESKDFPAMMKAYCDVIKESSSKSFRVASGAIFFAVFRGKVAEGIDFSDNEARCVLAIGIPYRNKNDVSMKMDYNNSNKSKGFLPGREWYTVDALRALNQALGRCIRHKNDWGAVLLVDERFRNQNFINYLPKWIKTKWIYDDGNYDLQTELENFVEIQIARERGKKCVAAV
ncbi:Fanconi anemia group J protein-like isoform X3 [Formica exsecta]|uniref:Fanconi anemia group J protein-like isoform X3 n=2 Tax=Formica exsecta TaxID=72781 RepID=UPI0011446C52|nr:Fanconi anemia group J protein-like isoform X3 [Formica exsecta]